MLECDTHTHYLISQVLDEAPKLKATSGSEIRFAIVGLHNIVGQDKELPRYTYIYKVPIDV